MPFRHRRLPRPASLLLVPSVGALLFTSAWADPVPGFLEHWNTGNTAGWGGGATYANPGTRGVNGAGDGYLRISTPGPSPAFTLNLGATAFGAPYTGNWQAAGIKHVKFWLNDVNAPQVLEMHFGIGTQDNFWQYNAAFIPAAGAWTQFTVDLSSSTGWTHIINATGGTFDAALQGVTRVLVRHDNAPYGQLPDTLTADVGLDEFQIVADSTVGVPRAAAVAPRALELAPPSPNPSTGALTLTMRTFDASPVQLEIVDAAGRVIRRARLAAAAPGRLQWRWDGRTDAGAPAPAGEYRVRAFGAAGGMSRALVRLTGR